MNVCKIFLLMNSDNYLLDDYIEDITRRREDMNIIFEWQNNILRMSTVSE